MILQPAATKITKSNRFDDDDDDEPIRPARNVNDPAGELDRYLEEPREKKVKDVIRWWYERRETYPVLSRMALDYLSIPRKWLS